VYLRDEHECFAAKWHCIVSSRVGEGRVVSLSLRQTCTHRWLLAAASMLDRSLRASAGSVTASAAAPSDRPVGVVAGPGDPIDVIEAERPEAFILPPTTGRPVERVLQAFNCCMAGGLFQPHTSASLWLKCAHEIQEQKPLSTASSGASYCVYRARN